MLLGQLTSQNHRSCVKSQCAVKHISASRSLPEFLSRKQTVAFKGSTFVFRGEGTDHSDDSESNPKYAETCVVFVHYLHYYFCVICRAGVGGKGIWSYLRSGVTSGAFWSAGRWILTLQGDSWVFGGLSRNNAVLRRQAALTEQRWARA